MKRSIIGTAGIVLWVVAILLLVFLAVSARNGKVGQVNQGEAESLEIEKTAENMVELMNSGEFSKCIEKFDLTMKKALPEAKLKEAWDSVVGQAGEFQKQTGSRYERVWGYDVIFVSCQFENTALDTKVVFNKNGEIAGLFFVQGK